ncbi:acetylornithine transaminase [Bacillus sp. 31A1R]|uniref:Acetylornithine aminotransferase n=1 Tax=Robertmurraya mangrovi TaxID=3098077 RepID=A0ABU5IT52_9BACI|nr:acetylornithine transaminase [Bacillus sp. 31A1R]MDZ5470322.1 acetylornithine transaminase [Bacillus sp. 31A1R]
MSHLFPTYARMNIEPVHAEGCYITDKTGKRYIDFTSGIGVCNLGHQPPSVKSVIEKQLNQFWHVSNLFEQEGQEVAAKSLAEAAEMDSVFFSNSGAEANEGAIKLARKATGRSKIITFEKSFHGRTFGAMSATGQDKIKQGFGPMLEGFVYVPFNDFEALETEMGQDIAAVMLEVIQGEGGLYVGSELFLKQVESLCKQYGALLVIDEIQTGIGRTGKPFAFQHFNLNPDIVTSAKGLGSGLPIGAIIGKEYLNEYFGPGSHGSTFGGNPIAISAANQTMKEIFNQEFLLKVNEKSELVFSLLQSQLNRESIVKEVRGLGLMIGIELASPVQPLLTVLRERGVLALPAGDTVLRLLPPLIMNKEELEEGITIICNTINEMVYA